MLVGHHGRQVVDVPVAAAITAADSEAAAVCTLRHVRHYRDVALQLLFE
ncbi:hypothetical protein P6B95_14360 [Streptomyces atratus]|nr:hypothetical protein [Streptomyces atratus]WPW33776.1 hypothetical protein P6B95_14360 [Streptomyces atratus]